MRHLGCKAFAPAFFAHGVADFDLLVSIDFDALYPAATDQLCALKIAEDPVPKAMLLSVNRLFVQKAPRYRWRTDATQGLHDVGIAMELVEYLKIGFAETLCDESGCMKGGKIV